MHIPRVPVPCNDPRSQAAAADVATKVQPWPLAVTQKTLPPPGPSARLGSPGHSAQSYLACTARFLQAASGRGDALPLPGSVSSCKNIRENGQPFFLVPLKGDKRSQAWDTENVKKSKILDLGVSCQSVSAYRANMRTRVQIPSAHVTIWRSGNPSTGEVAGLPGACWPASQAGSVSSRVNDTIVK